MENNRIAEDDDVIILSSDDDGDDTQTKDPANCKKDKGAKTPAVGLEVKTEQDLEEKEPENVTEQGAGGPANNNNSDNAAAAPSNADEAPQPNIWEHGLPAGFTFDAFALFGPENASMPIEERLSSFISNVQSLTEEKIKLENAERVAKRQCDEATTQLASANQEISELQQSLSQSHITVDRQNSSISDLQNCVDMLKKHENLSKTKLKSITSTLENLQSKMSRILEETEMDRNSSSETFERPGQKAAAFTISADPVPGSIAIADVLLKENIENFEKDFETKFSQIEEQDREIRRELNKTNELLQRIQFSLIEQFQTESSASSSPQLTHESMMDDPDMEDEQAPGSSLCKGSGGSYNDTSKKVQL